MSPPSETDKYGQSVYHSTAFASSSTWSADNFEESMKMQGQMFQSISLGNQRLLYDSVADLKLGLIISHGELSGKVDNLTLGQNRVESTLSEHKTILLTLQENITDLRMDLLHGITAQEPQQQQQQGGGNQGLQQDEIVSPPGFSSPIAVPIGSQLPACFITQPTADQEGIQTGSISEGQCPPTTTTAAAAADTINPTETTTTTTITLMTPPEVIIGQPLTSSPDQEMLDVSTNQAEVTNDQVEVTTNQVEVSINQVDDTTHQPHSNNESAPSQEGNGGQAEINQPTTLPTPNSVPAPAIPQSAQQSTSEIGQIVIDSIVVMDDCCGGEISVPIKYTRGRTRTMDSYECYFCKKSYSSSYYSIHIKNVCMRKQNCLLCKAPPRAKSSKSKKRGRH